MTANAMRLVGPIERFMVEDHVRVDRFLASSEQPNETFDGDLYERFRGGMLRHIAIEEDILLPYARARRGSEPLALEAALRADHREIAKLLALRPSPAIVSDLRVLLGRHNALEEGPQGLYAACDEFVADEGSRRSRLVDLLLAQPPAESSLSVGTNRSG